MTRPSPAQTPGPQRPVGEVLWLHANSANRLEALRELGERIQSHRDDLIVLTTSNQDLAKPPMSPESDVYYDLVSSDHPTEVRRFLDHWQPDICLWAGSDLMPNLISQAADRNIPLILLDIGGDDFPSRSHNWFPDLTLESLSRFETILTTGPEVAAMLRRLGLPEGKISTGEPLRNSPIPEPVDEASFSHTSQQLAGRPLWHAAFVQVAEIDTCLSAHRFALRYLHRLLLVVTVAEAQAADLLNVALKKAGLRHAFWQDGENIDDNTQVLICASTDDLGLWFRMAPLTFMASSLNIGNSGRDPREAVSLGSAILFGPHVPKHRETYTRLVSAGAGLSVSDAQELGTEVVRLAAPDNAAAMALEGWRIATEGAAMTDQLVDMVQDRLDSIVLTHART